MTLSDRSSSDAFARALESGAPSDTDTRLLAALAARLEGLPSALSVGPDPAYRDALRRRLLAVAAVQGVGATAAAPAPGALTPAALGDRLRAWGLARRASRATALAAGGLAGVVAIAGVGTAGSRSLPGDPFYGVKTAAESVQLAAADGVYEEGVRHLQFADTRLREVRALATDRPLALGSLLLGPAAPGTPVAAAPLAAGDAELAERVTQALDDLDRHMREGEEALVTAHEQGDGDDPLGLLAQAAASQARGLRAVASLLPVEVRARALESADVAAEVMQSANALLQGTACDETCRPDPAPRTPSAPTPGTPPAPCGCPAPEPSAAPERPTPTATVLPPATPTPSRTPTRRPSAQPTRQPSPEPSPTTGPRLPLPLPPLPVEPPDPEPTPPLPVPLPTDLPTSAPAPASAVGSATSTELPSVPGVPLPLPNALPPLPTIG